jgi:outer membrane protein assembly factor BamD
MKKVLLVSTLIFFAFNPSVWGYWIWSPKTNKWVNPKYETKDNPKKQLTYALEFYNARKYKEAMREFNKLINKFPKSFEASEAQFFIGRCWEKQGKLYEAFLAYQTVIDKYPFSERTVQILERQYQIGERYLEKSFGFWQSFSGQEHPAIEIFRTVVNNAPYSEYADKAQYKVGLVLKGLGRIDEAKEEFAKLIDEYPQSEWVKAAKYQIALIDAEIAPDPEYSQESAGDAVKGFEEFVKQYPDAQLSQQAKEHIRQLKEKEAKKNFDIAKFYEKQKSFDSAKIYYRYVFENYPESSLAAQALERYRILEKP